MNAKEIALIITFAGIAIILNPSISKIGLAFPPIPSLIINLWEIPVIVGFLLMGFRSGILIAIINSLFLFGVWPGPSNPIYSIGCIISASSMMTAIFIFSKFGNKPKKQMTLNSKKAVSYSTIAAIILRIFVMAPVMYVIVKSPPLIFPDAAVFGIILPWQAVYNIIQPIISVPIAFMIAYQIEKRIYRKTSLAINYY